MSSGVVPRLAVALLATGVLVSGCANALAEGEALACAAPTVRVEPASTTAGGQVVVHGENFLGGCPESSSGNRGTGTITATEEVAAYSDVRIQMSENGGFVTLAVVDADDDGTFEVPVQVPEDVGSGVIELTTDVDGTDPVQLVVGIS